MCVFCDAASGYSRLLDLEALQSSDLSSVNFVHVDVKVLGELVLTDAAKKEKKKQNIFTSTRPLRQNKTHRPVQQVAPMRLQILHFLRNLHSGVFRETSVTRWMFACAQPIRERQVTRHTLAGGLTSLCLLKSVTTSENGSGSSSNQLQVIKFTINHTLNTITCCLQGTLTPLGEENLTSQTDRQTD